MLEEQKDRRIRNAGKAKAQPKAQTSQTGAVTKGASRVQQMERKLATQVGAAVYATRKFIVEPVFGQIKQARGFRQFLLRGLEICMTHNILKFHKIICSG